MVPSSLKISSANFESDIVSINNLRSEIVPVSPSAVNVSLKIASN
jgi:hypothetical protein